MAIIGEFTTPSSEFLLAQTLAAVPELTVEIERMVSDGNGRVTPYFWIGRDSDGDVGIDAVLAADRTVTDLELVERHEDLRLYRACWNGNDEGLLVFLGEIDATILTAIAQNGDWDLRILFPEQGALSTFHDYCIDQGLAFELERFYDADDPTEYGKYGVTEDQTAALVTAHELGYFEVPRRCSLEDVAAELGVSRNAVSTRLRRGHAALVDATLVHDDPQDTLEIGDGDNGTRDKPR